MVPVPSARVQAWSAVLVIGPRLTGAAKAGVPLPVGAAPGYSISCPLVSTAYRSGLPSVAPVVSVLLMGPLTSPGEATLG